MRVQYSVLFFVLILVGIFQMPVPGSGAERPVTGAASAADAPDWRTEFEDICVRTADAQAMTVEDLTRLVSRCEALRPQIERLNESERKVFLKRLKMCEDLFRYVLESKGGGK
jgi:hypothetical protein